MYLRDCIIVEDDTVAFRLCKYKSDIINEFSYRIELNVTKFAQIKKLGVPLTKVTFQSPNPHTWYIDVSTRYGIQ